MSAPDLNLLITLDALLTEGSVAGAARRLRLSPSAMSRALARLRQTTGDPLLVRAGRGLVPTPRALALRDDVHALVRGATAALSPQDDVDLKSLRKTYTLRTGEGFVETFCPALVTSLQAHAPHVKLRFLPKSNLPKPDLSRSDVPRSDLPPSDAADAPLRDGRIDLEIGLVGKATNPEIRVLGLFRDRFIGVVRPGHPCLSAEMTPALYASGDHVATWRHGIEKGPIDGVLDGLGLARHIVVMVGGFAAALALVRTCDLIATVPERSTGAMRNGLHPFPLPVPTPEVTVSLLWHPRMDADPGHRWLRQTIRRICQETVGAFG